MKFLFAIIVVTLLSGTTWACDFGRSFLFSRSPSVSHQCSSSQSSSTSCSILSRSFSGGNISRCAKPGLIEKKLDFGDDLKLDPTGKSEVESDETTHDFKVSRKRLVLRAKSRNGILLAQGQSNELRDGRRVARRTDNEARQADLASR